MHGRQRLVLSLPLENVIGRELANVTFSCFIISSPQLQNCLGLLISFYGMGHVWYVCSSLQNLVQPLVHARFSSIYSKDTFYYSIPLHLFIPPYLLHAKYLLNMFFFCTYTGIGVAYIILKNNNNKQQLTNQENWIHISAHGIGLAPADFPSPSTPGECFQAKEKMLNIRLENQTESDSMVCCEGRFSKILWR